MLKGPRKYILLVVAVIVVIIAFAVGAGDSGPLGSFQEAMLSQQLPEYSEIVSNLSDTFIIKPEDYYRITTATPYSGLGEVCAHSGGHIHFTDKDKPYEVDVISPVDGYVSRVEPCFQLDAGNFKHDKFDISIAFAKLKGTEVSFSYSIEPVAAQNCLNDPTFYEKYILVKRGDKVKKGQVIARMPKLPHAEGSGTHIHFNLNWDGSQKLHCPNIFNSEIENAFKAMNVSQFTCGSTEFPATFCYNPEEGADLRDYLSN